MKNRFTLFRRGKVFYFEDREAKLQKSLGTKNLDEARKIVQAKNDAVHQPMMNLVMAKTFLAAQDPKMITRTWADVFDRFVDRENEATAIRHERVVRTKAMQFLKDKRLIETTADDLISAMKIGPDSTIAYLQTMHNDALGMGWIPAAILPRKLWPKMTKKAKRAITEAEHITLMIIDGDMTEVALHDHVLDGISILPALISASKDSKILIILISDHGTIVPLPEFF